MKTMISDFIIAGIASCGATLVTNPIEVIKTRIQLQGELAAKGTHVTPYKSVGHAFVTVAKNDGLKGLQKGLIPALYFQLFINGSRLSIYNKALREGWIKNSKGEVTFIRALFWGAIGGVIGSFVSSPFFMVKTQLQAQAAKKIAVGYQHQYSGMMEALSSIYRKHGIAGLWRGAMAAVPRAAIGSGAQIATFGKTKYLLKQYGLVENPTFGSFCAGISAGSVMSMAITPPDVIATRLYNQGVDEQGRGLLYKNYLDCVVKIFKTEGLYGLYKGFWPNYLRVAPHSVLVLLLFDEFLALRDRFEKSRIKKS